jgi:glycine/D-amino acid oxidase-like deaminating enzyme
MTAQKPPKGLGVTPQGAATQAVESWAGMRAFVFYPEASVNTFLYLTQQRASDLALSEREGVDKSNECPPPSGELMLGGWMGGNGLTEVGIADDRGWNRSTANDLSHATEECFSVDDPGGERGNKAHMIAQWGGILGVSVDDLPWIGRIPVSITARLAPQLRSPADDKNGNNMDGHSLAGALDSDVTIAESSHRASARLAAPGEWMAAGYSGEGMVHAWMSAKALAYMVLGLEKVSNPSQDGRDKLDGSVGDWFPDVFRLTEERWENTGAESLIVRTLF